MRRRRRRRRRRPGHSHNSNTEMKNNSKQLAGPEALTDTDESVESEVESNELFDGIGDAVIKVAEKFKVKDLFNDLFDKLFYKFKDEGLITEESKDVLYRLFFLLFFKDYYIKKNMDKSDKDFFQNDFADELEEDFGKGEDDYESKKENEDLDKRNRSESSGTEEIKEACKENSKEGIDSNRFLFDTEKEIVFKILCILTNKDCGLKDVKKVIEDIELIVDNIETLIVSGTITDIGGTPTQVSTIEENDFKDDTVVGIIEEPVHELSAISESEVTTQADEIDNYQGELDNLTVDFSDEEL